jgi:hypothetical protein
VVYAPRTPNFPSGCSRKLLDFMLRNECRPITFYTLPIGDYVEKIDVNPSLFILYDWDYVEK